MVKTTKTQFYIGTITYIKDDPLKLLDKPLEYHEVIIDIPGVMEYIKAFPEKGSLDEPKPGDLVLVTVYDPVYYSYNVYQKLKENDFIGFRSSGKMVDITPDKITIGVFEDKPERPYKDEERPDVSQLAHLEMTKDGEITVHAAKIITVNADSDTKIIIKGNTKIEVSGNTDVKVSGNTKIEVSGNTNVEVSGNTDVKVSGNTKINSPSVEVTGGVVKVGNTPLPPQGFCGIPNCIFSGAPHTINQMPST